MTTMFSFNLSAPGTVFLYGNPMIQYKKTCVAVGLDMRTKLSFVSLYPRSGIEVEFIEISFNSIRLNVQIPLHLYLKYFYGENSNRISTSYPLHHAVKDFVTSLRDPNGIYNPNNREHRLSLQAFFYLFFSVDRQENISVSSFTVRLSTELPIGENLGSSASFAVCLAACFWRLALLKKGIFHIQFNIEDLMKIVDLAYHCDYIIYKSRAMINTIASAYGSVAIFKEGLLQDIVTDIPSMKILLVFSNVSQKIRSMENSQRQTARRSHPFLHSIADSIDAISKTSIQMFNMIMEEKRSIYHGGTNGNAPTDQSDLLMLMYERLSSLMHMNQGLLKALGMSHQNLDLICAIAQEFSSAGKLTGKGGAGYAFILLPPDITDEIIDELLNVLKPHNFPAVITNLFCSGLKVEY